MSPEEGTEATIKYVGRTTDGTVFDTTLSEYSREDDTEASLRAGEHEPLTFELGSGRLLGALEDVVREMAVGDRRTVRLAPEEAYGTTHDDLVVQVDRDGVRDVTGKEPEPGMTIMTPERTDGRIREVTDETVTIDFNHRLAGETVEFDLELLAVDEE